ncbi:hypothetical protein TorRG33x02_314220 [Trema orientale]|uniref:Uncharacterized protein n=1 Tax=Trema orientale TaxID=63057 RepID=A0A2P5BNX0_TREOI|nr:hypothetical protein TorRG33x02_314220 [Trema orientale]
MKRENGDATLIPREFLPPERPRRYPTNPGCVHLRTSKATICLKNEIAATSHESSLAGRSYFPFSLLSSLVLWEFSNSRAISIAAHNLAKWAAVNKLDDSISLDSISPGIYLDGL